MSVFRHTADNGRTASFHTAFDPGGNNPPTYEGSFGTQEFNQYLVEVWRNYPTCTLSVEKLTYKDLCGLLAAAGVDDPDKVAVALAFGIGEGTP